jgi:hypothetical protein
VHVRVDKPRHYQSALRINVFGIGVFFPQSGSFSHFFDERSVNKRRTIIDKRTLAVPGNEFAISNQQHGSFLFILRKQKIPYQKAGVP